MQIQYNEARTVRDTKNAKEIDHRSNGHKAHNRQHNDDNVEVEMEGTAD